MKEVEGLSFNIKNFRKTSDQNLTEACKKLKNLKCF